MTRMIPDPVRYLREKVKAAIYEYEFAMQMHESWRIAAEDSNLHQRVSNSYAGQTFLIVRVALRREMLLALFRLWDKQNGAVEIASIADCLERPDVLESLLPNTFIYADARAQAAKAIALIRDYQKVGSKHSTLKTLVRFRNEVLAHHQTASRPSGSIAEDKLEMIVDQLYQDSATLITLLEHVVNRTAYNPKEAAEVYNYYAKFFWKSVTSERIYA